MPPPRSEDATNSYHLLAAGDDSGSYNPGQRHRAQRSRRRRRARVASEDSGKAANGEAVNSEASTPAAEQGLPHDETGRRRQRLASDSGATVSESAGSQKASVDEATTLFTDICGTSRQAQPSPPPAAGSHEPTSEEVSDPLSTTAKG